MTKKLDTTGLKNPSKERILMLAEIIKAEQQGRTVEMRWPGGIVTWTVIANPNYNPNGPDYRIKPRQRTVYANLYNYLGQIYTVYSSEQAARNAVGIDVDDVGRAPFAIAVPVVIEE